MVETVVKGRAIKADLENLKYDWRGELARVNYLMAVDILADPRLFPNRQVNGLMYRTQLLISSYEGMRSDLSVSDADDFYYQPAEQEEGPPMDTLFVPRDLAALSDRSSNLWHNEGTHKAWFHEQMRKVVKGSVNWLDSGKSRKSLPALINSFDKTIKQKEIDLLAIWQQKMAEQVYTGQNGTQGK